MKRNVILTSIVILVLTIGIVLNTLDITEITVKLAGYEEVCSNTTTIKNYVVVDKNLENCAELCKAEECYLGYTSHFIDYEGWYTLGKSQCIGGEDWSIDCFISCVNNKEPHLFFYNETICIENRLVKTLKR